MQRRRAQGGQQPMATDRIDALSDNRRAGWERAMVSTSRSVTSPPCLSDAPRCLSVPHGLDCSLLHDVTDVLIPCSLTISIACGPQFTLSTVTLFHS